MADASKAHKALGWEPRVTFRELVRIMVDADLKEIEERMKGGTSALKLAAASEGRQ